MPLHIYRQYNFLAKGFGWTSYNLLAPPMGLKDRLQLQDWIAPFHTLKSLKLLSRNHTCDLRLLLRIVYQLDYYIKYALMLVGNFGVGRIGNEFSCRLTSKNILGVLWGDQWSVTPFRDFLAKTYDSIINQYLIPIYMRCYSSMCKSV